MIEVKNLTKTYGDTVAVNDISFNIQKGEIVGLLGPNGAGKTTTMRILTCYLPADYGTATVAGVSVESDSEGRPVIDAKANIGLPPTRLIGQVNRSGDSSPIPYAKLRLRASNVKTTARKTGQYTFSGVEAGKQTVHVSATGFAPLDQKVTLAPGQDTVVDFTLTPT